MGRFYTFCPAQHVQLWHYSERGLMAHLFHKLVVSDPGFLLRWAMDDCGGLLEQKVKDWNSATFITECDLGSEGFGSPDGAACFRGATQDFVFVECKATTQERWFGDVQEYRDLALKVGHSGFDLEGLCRSNQFNSTLNGQLEMRWRFWNAVRATAQPGLVRESEPSLTTDLMQTDRYYWRSGMTPRDLADWRRVYMGHELRPLFNLVSGSSTAFLLAITDDEEYPERLRLVRRSDPLGRKVAWSESPIYWIPLSIVREELGTP